MLPYLLLLITIIVIFLNFLAFMKVLPLMITLPLLFVSIYVTLYAFTRQRMYRPMR